MTRARRHLPLAVLLLACVALCLPLVLLPGSTPYTFDETNFYLPAIRQIRAEWPRLDISANSLSATAPGYQYLLATLSFLTGPSLLALRFLNLALSFVLPLVLWFAWPAETCGWLRACALVPLVGGCFFIRAASNLMTDNVALLATAGTLALVFGPGLPRGLAVAGTATAFAVIIRQNTIWLEAPLAVRWLVNGRPASSWALLPAPAVLSWLILSWGGLVPPAWQTHSGLGYAAAPYQLAVLGVLGIFFYASISPDWRADLGNRWTWAGAATGLLLALVCPTAPDYDAGRWGGYFWTAAEHLPVFGRRSVLFFALAPCGGGLLATLTRRLWSTAGTHTTLLWLSAFISFFASGLLNRQVHHRYYEPVLLVLLVFWLLLLTSAKPSAPAVRFGPLLALGTGQVMITLLTAYGRTFGFF